MTKDIETFVTPYYEVKGFSPTEKLFVMTDLHGCSQAMSRLLKHYDGSSKVVFLGDAIDRGPDSYGVVKKLLELDALCILGNHEYISLAKLYPEKEYNKKWGPIWNVVNGGHNTLDSFFDAIENGAEYTENKNDIRVPKIYDDYIRRCQSHYLSGNILFTHAGIPPQGDVKFYEDPLDPEHFDDKFLWWRPSTHLERYRYEPRIFNGQKVFSVSGHTPTNPGFVRQEYGIELDTGHVLKLALEIEPDSDRTNCRYRIIGTLCSEVHPCENICPSVTVEQIFTTIKRCIEERALLKGCNYGWH
ncbi:metallophosphoesterase [Succinivibrio dextrinosolvens]|uniref:Calcineurin-like phosphoesterase n=1 Tax=Succinivibrio dextrinosolvens TaxID=83771 RepID=A0A662ZEC5_9GAMM|nr:metallophosphoesterase [Succinivibrio dextrinosolvens]SFK46524.1 Calcineurin-like phosphoesterase [Succinivibrio dextrinosolvens]